MELNGHNEIIFHVPSRRTVSSFNNLSEHLKFNDKFMPAQFSVDIGADSGNRPGSPSNNMMTQSTVFVAVPQGLKRQSTAWISPKEHAKVALQEKIRSEEYIDPV